MSDKTGGPAFPFVEPNVGCNVAVGITTRDYFAAKAMQGLMVDVNEPNCPAIARMSFEMADAMLEARSK